MGVGIVFYDILKMTMLLEKHCRKPKLDTDEGPGSRRDWEGSFLPYPGS